MKCGIGYVSLLRSEENLFRLVFYKHFGPKGRGAVQNIGRRRKSLQKNKKLIVCFAKKLNLGHNGLVGY
jgi:hypothetical protein